MNYLILKLITLTHLLLVLFIIAIPFTDSNYFLLLHAIFIPFMMIHWICNDNTCVLTIVERKIRKMIKKEKEDDKDCFTCRLIEPIYDFKKNYESFSKTIYLVTIGLWLISAGRLYYMYQIGDIKSYYDLFII